MFKQLATALLLFCMSVSSYAYLIESTLKIKNNTDTPLIFVITNQTGAPFKKAIPAHSESTIDKDVLNYHNSGLLYTASTHEFQILSDDAESQLYVQGRVVYYIHGSYAYEYSFLDSLSAAEGLTVNPHYSCEASTDVFNNEITIDGKPSNTLLTVFTYPKSIYCQGFKSSTIEDKDENKNSAYKAECMSGRTGVFDKMSFWVRDGDAKLHYGNFDEGVLYHIYAHLPESSILDGNAIKKALDNALSNGSPGRFSFECNTYINCNEFCSSWSKENVL